MTGSSRADIGIVGHIDRLTQANKLADDVDAAFLSIDDGTLKCEGNHVAVWRHLASASTPWSVVLEDDALPVTDFRNQLVGVLKAAPTPIVSLYLGRTRPPAWQPWVQQATINADRQDVCFIPAKRLLHAVGIAMHTRLIGAMVRAVQDIGLPMDEAIHVWAQREGYPVTYCWPSIVDHRDGPTVIPRHRDGMPRTEPRTAWSCGRRSRWASTTLSM